MRIAYLFHLNQRSSAGVVKKISNQAAAWTGRGHEVRLFQVTRDSAEGLRWEVPNEVLRYQRGILGRLKVWSEARRRILSGNPDIVYYRYDLYYPGIARLAGSVPLVIEVNSNDLREYLLSVNTTGIYNLLTRNGLFRAASGAVFVSRELARSSDFSRLQAPCVVIGNSISLQAHSELAPGRSDVPTLAFLGTDKQAWHGVDKILWLARARKNWKFYLIGISATPERERPDNVSFYGPMKAIDYRRLLAECDVAIGSLAMHRNRMSEASPLKVREYLALGIPTVIGYNDTDFPREPDFLLNIGNTESNVADNLGRIDSFVQGWRGRRVPRQDVAHLDSEVKESARLSFFESLVGKGRSGGVGRI